jgi:hypothetical protein
MGNIASFAAASAEPKPIADLQRWLPDGGDVTSRDDPHVTCRPL